MIPLRGRRCVCPRWWWRERAKRGGTRRLVLVSVSLAAAATNRDANQLHTPARDSAQSRERGRGERMQTKPGRVCLRRGRNVLSRHMKKMRFLSVGVKRTEGPPREL